MANQQQQSKRTSNTTLCSKKLQPYIKYASFIVVYHLLWTLARHANFHALAAPLVARDNEPVVQKNRDSTFQILADGTQDLAALIGLFATDSVERYVIDYSQGPLSVAMATCSMLGLLGYIRALLKLGMGAEACEHAAFPTIALRPLLGVARRDRLSSDECTIVRYLRCYTHRGYDVWNIVKSVRHTAESMPLTGCRTTTEGRPLDFVQSPVWSLRLLEGDDDLQRHRVFLRFLVLLAMTIAPTTLAILPFTPRWSYDQPIHIVHQPMSWTKIWAVVGLPLSLFGGSVMWAFVYCHEQIPSRQHTEHSRYCKEGVQEPTVLANVRKLLPPWRGSTPGVLVAEIACFRIGSSMAMFGASSVDGMVRKVIKALSFASAASAILGYICQYIELRQTSSKQSGIWLAIQGGLAILRVGYWTLRPSLQNVSRQRPLAQAGRVDMAKPTAIEIPLFWSSTLSPDEEPPSLKVPHWVIQYLNSDRLDLQHAFTLSEQARAGSRNKDIKDYLSSRLFWDMPSNMFTAWLFSQARGEFPSFAMLQSLHWGCRMIKVGEDIQLWPGLYRIPVLKKPTYIAETVIAEASIFSFSKVSLEKNLYAIPFLETIPLGEGSGQQHWLEGNEDGFDCCPVFLEDDFLNELEISFQEMITMVSLVVTQAEIQDISRLQSHNFQFSASTLKDVKPISADVPLRPSSLLTANLKPLSERSLPRSSDCTGHRTVFNFLRHSRV